MTIADNALHQVNDTDVNPPGTAAPYATNANPTALPLAFEGLQRQDLDMFVSGYVLTKAAACDDPEFELADVPENVNDQVWACLDLGMDSANAVVNSLTTAARRALKPVHAPA